MMTHATQSAQAPAANVVVSRVRTLLGNRRRQLLILGATVLALGLFLKWNWLVAAGVTPLLFSALPCVAMCALGLCMSKMSNSSAPAKAASSDQGAEVLSDMSAPSQLVPADGSAPINAAAPIPNVKPGPVSGKSCCH